MAKRAKIRQYTQSMSVMVSDEMYLNILDHCQTHNIGLSDFLRNSVEVYLRSNYGDFGQT
jgi:hypothetical protein